MISRCSSLSSSVHATPDISRSFLLLYRANAADGEKFHFSRSGIVKRNPITVAENFLEFKQHGKAKIGNSEWKKSLIHRSASMNHLCSVSDEHANCERASKEVY